MKSYDIVVMGAGHNGLVAAAYLAKAGKKVLILERQPFPGGGVVTREINTPGYKHDLHSSCHIMIQGNPMLTEDELGLFSKHGLKYNYSKVPYASIFPDQSTLITYKDLDAACAEIAKLSQRDADTYRKFALRSMAMLPMFVSGLYAPPAPLGPFMAMLDSSDEGREMLDAMSRSSLDIIDDAFENDKVKIHLLKLVTENLQLPDELGTGMGIFLMPGIIHAYGVSQPIGGSGGLTDALVKCLGAHGAEIRLNAEVTQILVKSGRATGVRLKDGEEILADRSQKPRAPHAAGPDFRSSALRMAIAASRSSSVISPPRSIEAFRVVRSAARRASRSSTSRKPSRTTSLAEP